MGTVLVHCSAFTRADPHTLELDAGRLADPLDAEAVFDRSVRA